MLLNQLRLIKNYVNQLKELPTFLSIVFMKTVLECFPDKVIRYIGNQLGILLYFFIPALRKTAHLNLNLIYGNEKTRKEKIAIAKKSLKHMAITLLEIITVNKTVRDIDLKIKIRTDENNKHIINNQQLKELFELLDSRKGVIFFCGHQANWEMPFLFITGKYAGIALAKTVKNSKIQNYLTKLRETRKGSIISPGNGISKSISALEKGKFIGIVGDQAFLRSDYSYPFMGYKAWTTTSPALLAYKTSCPVFGVSLKRYEKYHEITLTPPIFANKKSEIKEEIVRIMDSLLAHLEKGVQEAPEQWMWFHKRWKQKLNPKILKAYHYSFILILLPEAVSDTLLSLTQDLCLLYQGADISVAIAKTTTVPLPTTITKIIYDGIEQIKTIPNKFQMVFDFIDSRKLRKFYKKTGSLKIFKKNKFIKKECHLQHDDILRKTFLKPLQPKKETKNYARSSSC
ncbi:MAG: hypothetical protein RSB82_03250 [Victivallaceae bacterium]